MFEDGKPTLILLRIFTNKECSRAHASLAFDDFLGVYVSGGKNCETFGKLCVCTKRMICYTLP